MKSLAFLSLLILIFMSSCSKNDSGESSLEPEILHLTGWIGEDWTLSLGISTGFTFECKDLDKVSISILPDSDELYVKTIGEGYATINLIDPGQNILMVIIVSSEYFGSEDIEEISNHPTAKCEVNVEARDENVRLFIENELWEEIRLRKRTTYSFNSKTKEFSMNIPQLGESNQGTYEWSLDSLTLKYNDKIENYHFEFATGRRTYILLADKTAYYSSLYPDAGITKVTFSRLLYDWCVF